MQVFFCRDLSDWEVGRFMNMFIFVAFF